MEEKIGIGDIVRVKSKKTILSEDLELYNEMVVVSYQSKAYPEDIHKGFTIDKSNELYTGNVWCKWSFGGKDFVGIFPEEELILC